jgi:alpha-glucosidase
VLLGEMDTRNLERFAEYVADDSGLDLGFVLKLGAIHWEPDTIVSDLLAYDRAAQGGAAWALSNHDQARVVTRFGGGETGLRRALAVMTVMVALDGVPFLYQGEELGLPNAELVGAPHDPVSTRNPGHVGRDVARGPMPWDSTHLNGFSTAPHAWLQTAPLPTSLTAAAQRADPGSALHRYRELVSLRARFPELTTVPVDLFTRDGATAVITRGTLTLVANLGDAPFEFTPAGTTEVVFESNPAAARLVGGRLTVAPESTILLQRCEDR